MAHALGVRSREVWQVTTGVAFRRARAEQDKRKNVGTTAVPGTTAIGEQQIAMQLLQALGTTDQLTEARASSFRGYLIGEQREPHELHMFSPAWATCRRRYIMPGMHMFSRLEPIPGRRYIAHLHMFSKLELELYRQYLICTCSPARDTRDS